MTTIERQKIVYNLLCSVYKDGAYSGIVLNDELKCLDNSDDKSYVTAMFYGVLEKDVVLSYYVSRLCAKKPKNSVKILLKIGIYLLKFTSTPDYAVIDNVVKLCKIIGKKEVSGFINAVLRKTKEIELPIEEKTAESLSLYCSVPLWIAQNLISDYGYDKAKAILSAKLNTKTHVRPNLSKITAVEFEKRIENYEKSPLGYYVESGELKKFRDYEYTVMSLASMYAVRYYNSGIKRASNVLDTCSAPGGKAIYLEEIGLHNVVACDIHKHRVNLIKQYAKRMGSNITVKQNDATVYCGDWLEKFDAVICDVPCSGIGVISSKPDILLNRNREDVVALSDIQLKILQTSANYVKKGGTLFYSTCTVMNKENDEVVEKFLSSRNDFAIEKFDCGLIKSDDNGFVRLLPDDNGCDGFFVVGMRRNA